MGQFSSRRIRLTRDREKMKAGNLSRAAIPPINGKSAMSKLADVEMQLIMQHLEADELLVFARCNHRLMHAAESSFAWKYLIVSLDPDEFTSAQLSASRLLPHVRLSFQLHGSIFSDRFMSDSNMNLLLSCQYPLYGLDLSEIEFVTSDQSRQIFSHSNIRSIRTLHIFSPCRELLQHICSLPHLHTLRVNTILPDPSPWSLLVFAPSLTSLQLYDGRAQSYSGRSILPMLTQCSSIRHLHVNDLALVGFNFCSITSPLMKRLQSLTIDGFSANAHPIITAEQYANAFASLTFLHAIRLCNIKDVDVMLPHLSHSPVLRLLTIDPRPFSWFSALATLPSIHVLTDLKSQVPHLSIITSCVKEGMKCSIALDKLW